MSLSIITQKLPDGEVGLGYYCQLQAKDGTPPYEWLTEQLPTGLLCSPEGIISGIPAESYRANIYIQVKDKDGKSASRYLFLSVYAPILAKPLCYYVQALGPLNPTYHYYLKADPADLAKPVKLQKTPLDQLPIDNEFCKWLPIVFMAEAGKGIESNRGFVLQNSRTRTIIASSGESQRAILLPSEEITESLTAFHIIDGDQDSFKGLQIPQRQLVLDVSKSDWELGLVIMHPWHPATGRNQYWKFIKVESKPI